MVEDLEICELEHDVTSDNEEPQVSHTLLKELRVALWEDKATLLDGDVFV